MERNEKERLFKERMAKASLFDELEDYKEFIEKFNPKKTTDDCYTPQHVYDAVARYVTEEYGVKPDNFIRPFYPGGDYKLEHYPDGCAVVDNPPFSILSEIKRYYTSHGIKFFLFAPTLTLFESSNSSEITYIVTGNNITFENGAKMNISFVTNMGDGKIQFMSSPRLYGYIEEAENKNKKGKSNKKNKYIFPNEVIRSCDIFALSHKGIEFKVEKSESILTNGLDCGVEIFGRGYLISERAAAELDAAKRAAAELDAAYIVKLSERELTLIRMLRKKRNEENDNTDQ